MKANSLALSAIAIRLSSMVLGALVTIAIARISGAESVGHFALLVLFASYAATPVKGAVASILFRQLARARNDGERERAGALLKFSYRCLIYTLPVAAVFAGLMLEQVEPARSEPVGFVAIVVVAIMTFESWAAIQISALRGSNLSLFAQILDGVLRPLSVLVGVAAALIFGNPATPLTNLCFGYLAGLVSVRMLGAIMLHRAAAQPAVSAMRIREFFAAHGAQALFFLGASFTATVIANFDIVVGGLLLSVEQLGYYKIVLQLCVASNALYVGLNFHVARDFASYHRTEAGLASDVRQIEARARHYAWLCFLFAAAVTLVLSLVGNLLALLLFDATLATDWRLFAIIGSSFVVNGAFGMAGSFLMMNHDERFVLAWSILSIGISLPLGYAAAQAFSTNGVGIAALTIASIWNGGLALRCRLKFDFNPTIVYRRRFHA